MGKFAFGRESYVSEGVVRVCMQTTAVIQPSRSGLCSAKAHMDHGAALQHRILLHFGIPQDGVVSFSLHFGSRFVEVVVVVGDVSLEFFTPDFWGINRPDSA